MSRRHKWYALALLNSSQEYKKLVRSKKDLKECFSITKLKIIIFQNYEKYF
jgi:hypothetical protein